MRIGYFGGTINEGTIDDVVAEARQAEVDGYDTYWAPQIFGHDALTVLAIVGSESEVVDRIAALADIGVTDFAAVLFPGNPDEREHTRAAMKTLIG